MDKIFSNSMNLDRLPSVSRFYPFLGFLRRDEVYVFLRENVGHDPILYIL